MIINKKISNHIITATNLSYRESPNVGDSFVPPYPDTIILHYTASGDSDSSINHLCDPSTEVSAHFLISRDGLITQMVPCNRIAWHAGKSKWREREGLNKYSIGIEIENAGYLKKDGERYLSWFGGIYQKKDVLIIDNEIDENRKYWHAYTKLQIKVVTSLCKFLSTQYQIKEILGHSDVSPGRKVDPGPALPIDWIRHKALGKNETA